MNRPIIGITVDNKDNTADSGTYECAAAYCKSVELAGGLPVLLPHLIDRVDDYVDLCKGFILTGGVDPDTAPFGERMHDSARPMDPQRQAFELALIRRVRALPDRQLLGVCLGMQLMTLEAGGQLNQFLPDSHDSHEMHQGNRKHVIELIADDSNLDDGGNGEVVSSHRQAMATSGSLRVIAQASDGVIEAVDDPSRRFYVGVQWHPERGGAGAFNQGVINRLVEACLAPVDASIR